jgi:hypothetical protein
MYDIRKEIINTLAVLNLNRSQFCKKFGFDLPNFSTFLNGGNTLGTDKIQQIFNILATEKEKLRWFEITLLLANGNRLNVRVEAIDGDTAIKRISRQPEFLQMLHQLGDAEIISTTFKEFKPPKLDPKNYVLQPSEDEGWWVVTDTVRNIVCKFHEGNFNNTQTITPLFDSTDIDELDHATAMRQMGDFIHDYHKELL